MSEQDNSATIGVFCPECDGWIYVNAVGTQACPNCAKTIHVYADYNDTDAWFAAEQVTNE